MYVIKSCVLLAMAYMAQSRGNSLNEARPSWLPERSAETERPTSWSEKGHLPLPLFITLENENGRGQDKLDAASSNATDGQHVSLVVRRPGGRDHSAD